MIRSQKRRVQCLRNKELEAHKSNRPWAWHAKQTANKGKPSANIDMVFILPAEFRAPSRYEQEESNEEELEK
jgi:hypothetical protein